MAIDLSAIKKTSGLKPPSMIVFGSAGVGKTTFAAAAPNPIFLQTEAGEGALELSAFPLLKSYDELIEAITALIEHDHDYETLVLDSLDHLEPLIWKKVCQVEGKKSIEEFGYGKGYVFALDYWREFLAAINSLRMHKNMSLILIAHTHIRAYNSPDTESYDRYEIKLHAKASGLIQESVDSVLFAKHKIITKKKTKDLTRRECAVSALASACSAPQKRLGTSQRIDTACLMRSTSLGQPSNKQSLTQQVRRSKNGDTKFSSR